MSHKDNQDLRVRPNGGWGWFEHELFTMFAPIIGPAGVSVYIALARLIPLAGIDSDKAVRVRRVSEYSCVGRSKCAEEIRKLIALGMIIETKYFDGRDPTYKLASLQDLAKVGQKELLERVGVRNTDTAPFDQTAKHRRERQARDEKTRESSAFEAQGRPLPLLDDSEVTPSDGVRNTDTPSTETEVPNGVRNTDTVSAESAFVSANSAFVSAKSHSVSAPADTSLREEEKREDLITTPLPPAERGEVEADPGEDDPDQAMPGVPDCSFGDPGFNAAMIQAGIWVMAELGITKRRLGPVIDAQLRVYCRNNRDATVATAAAFMAKQGRALHTDAEMLRHRPWNWENFFGGGHWSRPLPYDHALRRAVESRVGIRSEEEEEREELAAEIVALGIQHGDRQRANAAAAEWSAITAPLLRSAAAYAKAGAPEELVEQLRALVHERKSVRDLREAVAPLEEQLCDAVMEALPDSDRELLTNRASREVAERNIPAAQVTAATESLMRRLMAAFYALPEVPLSQVYFDLERRGA